MQDLITILGLGLVFLFGLFFIIAILATSILSDRISSNERRHFVSSFSERRRD